MKARWRSLRNKVETGFWRSTASVAGLAAQHRRQVRWIPVAALAALTFFLGRAAGGFLQ